MALAECTCNVVADRLDLQAQPERHSILRTDVPTTVSILDTTFDFDRGVVVEGTIHATCRDRRLVAPSVGFFLQEDARAGTAILLHGYGRTEIGQMTIGDWVAFRKTFDLVSPPQQALLHILADSRYILWINGRYVDRGPCRFDPKRSEYDTLDVTSLLREFVYFGNPLAYQECEGATLNCYLYRALLDAAQLASGMGKSRHASAYAEAAKELREAINTQLKERLQFQITVPSHTTATVRIPAAGNKAEMILAGREISPGNDPAGKLRRAGRYIAFELEAGKHGGVVSH